MGQLIRAEFLKISTTKLWWALLIPAIALALGWGWLSAVAFTDIAGDISDAVNTDVEDVDIAVNLVALTRAMNFATLFPMVFGALALASEINRKTITTSFLTAASRSSVLGAKAIVYVLWGIGYGIVVAGSASLGVLIGSGGNLLPDAGDWILVLLTGILSCMLWTLFGMGVGALLGSPVATLVILLLYAALVGPSAELIITLSTEGSNIAGVMPNGSANGLTSSTAADLLYNQIQDQVQTVTGTEPSDDEQDAFNIAVRALAGAPGAFNALISGLIFAAWTAMFFAFGILRNKTRDVT